jgi:hypothetical protein
MTIPAPIRAALLVAASANCAVSFAATSAQSIPPTSTTVAAAPAAQPQAPAQPPSHRAQVGYSNGLLSVSADNSSLNQILREVSSLTGMKITGGVTDERVYGSYGPADTSTVLSALLRGTGSNMMLIFSATQTQTPSELVLTPRAGGPTPPSPNASRERDEEDLPPQRMPRMPRDGFPGQASRPTPPPQPIQPQPVAAPAANNPTPPAPADNTTTQESPNGVKTPQQIYDQLMKLQQQNQQNQQKQPPTTTPPQ